MTITIEPALLVEDWDLYPRHAVDSAHVSDIVRAMQAGGVIPPPLIDEKSKRIVDGFHRKRAAERLDVLIEVELQRFPNKAAMIEAAVIANSAHPRKLDQRDRTRSILLMEKAGLGQKRIAQALQTTPERVVKLRQRVVEVNGDAYPAKPAYWSKEGEEPLKISPAQVELIDAAPGWRHIQTVKHLTNDLREGLIRLDDERLVEALRELREALDEAL